MTRWRCYLAFRKLRTWPRPTACYDFPWLASRKNEVKCCCQRNRTAASAHYKGSKRVYQSMSRISGKLFEPPYESSNGRFEEGLISKQIITHNALRERWFCNIHTLHGAHDARDSDIIFSCNISLGHLEVWKCKFLLVRIGTAFFYIIKLIILAG